MGKLLKKLAGITLACTMLFASGAVMAEETEVKNLISKGAFDTDPNWGSSAVWQETGGMNNSACVKIAGNIANQLAASGLTSNSVIEVTAWVNLVAGATVSINAFPTVGTTAQSYNAYTQVAATDETVGTWQKIGLRLPLDDDETGFRVTIKSSVAGSLIDDLTGVYAEDGNLLINGDFEETQTLDTTKAFGWFGSNAAATLEGYSGKVLAVESGKNAFLYNIYCGLGTRYKLTFDYKTDTSGAFPRIVLDQNNANGGFSVDSSVTAEAWGSYTSYITVEKQRVGQASLYLHSRDGAGWFDNVSLTIVTDDVVAACFDSDVTPSENDYAGCTRLFIGRPELTELPDAGESFKLITSIWDSAFTTAPATATKTVVAGVYKTDGDTRQICSVQIANASRTDNADNTEEATMVLPGIAVLTLTMPEEAGTYTIEMCVWDSVSGLTPFASKTVVLSGSNAVQEA